MNLLDVQDLTVRYQTDWARFTAVRGVDLSIPQGGTLGLVGESGSGKSTVAKAILGLLADVSGKVILDGQDVSHYRLRQTAAFRHRVQMVFQDPYASLNPRMTVGEVLGEAIAAHRPLAGKRRGEEATRLLEMVGLEAEAAERYPHQFSGGQRQRIAIARALAVQPRLLVLDEVTSALDVSVQATILNLLKELQRALGLSYLFISHNLSVVRYMTDQVAVMYLGRVVEAAATDQLFKRPQHPYTRALIGSIPQMGARRQSAATFRLTGEIPDPRFPPSGCPFRTRCPIGPLAHPGRTACEEHDPGLVRESEGGLVACHFPLQEEASAWMQQNDPA